MAENQDKISDALNRIADTLTRCAELFEEKTTLSIKAAVLSNETLLDQILGACETAGMDLNAIFDKTVKVAAVDGLDAKQYSLGTRKLPQFRTLVRQNKPALK